MEPTAPLSPAPSNDDLYSNGLHHLMRHNANTSFPREHLSPDDMGCPGSHSRYGTPSPQHDMPFDHASPYQRGHDGQLYPSAFEPANSMYALAGEPSHQPYSTPETSPPTPSRRPDGLTTRSGLTIQKSASPPKHTATRSGRIEKQAPRKRKDRGKGGKKSEDIQRPLSELAAEHPDAFIADIASYVNRSREERLKEVEQSKTPGKIKRPMNAFMLYRKAYQHLAKLLCTQNNHQLVSQVCGSGWPLEPETVREQFNDWAKLERVNHQEAHPGYKFTPSKPKPKTRDDDDLKSDDGELDDYDWATGGRATPRRPRARTPHGRQDTTAPSYLGVMQQMPVNMNMAPQHMYHYAQPPRHMGSPYSHAAMPPQPFYQQTIHQRHDNQGFVEDIMVRRGAHSPQMTYAAPPTEDRYDMIPHYAQMAHNDLGLDSMIDPGLVGPNGNPYPAAGYADPLADSQHRWQNPLLGEGRQDMPDGMSGYDDAFLHDPQMQILRGQDSSWRVEELADSSHFNNWMEPTE